MAEPKTKKSTISVVAVRSLNDFSDDILLRILSSFPTTRDAGRTTSLISRKWRNLWRSTPSLSFSCRSFSYPTINQPPETFQSFVNFVAKTLIRRPSNSPDLLSFKLKFDFSDCSFTYSSDVNAWIRFAISNNAQILDLDLFDYYGNVLKRNVEDYVVHFEFPFFVLRDTHVKVLKLRGCILCLPPSENMRFFSLRSLCLENVVMTDQMLVDLMVACENVESLVLSSVRGCKDIKICSSKLRELSLEYLSCVEVSVEIVAPNMYTLTIDCFHVGNYALRDASSLVQAYVNLSHYDDWIKVMRLLGHVKNLTLINWFFELMESKDIFAGCFIFRCLKYVELWTTYTKSDPAGIAVLLDLSPNLHTMILNNCLWRFGEESEETIPEEFFTQINWNLPSLRHVTMKSFMRSECELNLLQVLYSKGVVIEKITLVLPDDEEADSISPIIVVKGPSGPQVLRP